MEHFYDVITFVETKAQNKPVLFTSELVDKSTIPSELYVYDLSINEDDFEFDKIGIELIDNKIAVIISLTPLKLDDKNEYKCTPKDLYIGKSQDFIDLEDFFIKHAKKGGFDGYIPK